MQQSAVELHSEPTVFLPTTPGALHLVGGSKPRPRLASRVASRSASVAASSTLLHVARAAPGLCIAHGAVDIERVSIPRCASGRVEGSIQGLEQNDGATCSAVLCILSRTRRRFLPCIRDVTVECGSRASVQRCNCSCAYDRNPMRRRTLLDLPFARRDTNEARSTTHRCVLSSAAFRQAENWRAFLRTSTFRHSWHLEGGVGGREGRERPGGG